MSGLAPASLPGLPLAYSLRCLRRFSKPVALSLDGDDLGVMDDAIDERGGAGCVGKDGWPGAEGQVRGQDEAPLFIAAAHDLEEEIRVAVVVREVPELIDDHEGSPAVVAEPGIESTGRVLAGEIEKELGGGEEEYGVSLQDRFVSDVLRDHGLAQALRCDQDNVAILLKEVESQSGLDGVAIDLAGPGPVEVGDSLEASDSYPLGEPISAKVSFGTIV